MSLFAAQLSKNLLFEAMRREIRRNVSYVDNFPWMKGRYEEYYNRMDLSMAMIQRKYMILTIYSLPSRPFRAFFKTKKSPFLYVILKRRPFLSVF